jgi:hypothetical protein
MARMKNTETQRMMARLRANADKIANLNEVTSHILPTMGTQIDQISEALRGFDEIKGTITEIEALMTMFKECYDILVDSTRQANQGLASGQAHLLEATEDTEQLQHDIANDAVLMQNWHVYLQASSDMLVDALTFPTEYNRKVALRQLGDELLAQWQADIAATIEAKQGR